MYLYNKFGDAKPYDNRGYNMMVQTIREYKNIFQHICTPIDPFLYIKRSFDLDICKNTFDGNNLYVKDWNKLIERRDIIRPNGYIMLFYECRGTYDDIYSKRLKKYIDRGFELKKHAKYNEIIEYMKMLSQENTINKNLLNYVADGTLDLESFDSD